jgi:hypothetical protein
MAFAKTEKELAERAARHLKAELKRAEVTYEQLAERLDAHGFNETKASVASYQGPQYQPIFSWLL